MCVYTILFIHSSIREHLDSMSCVCAKLLQLCRLFVTLWSVACQAPLSMGFSQQEYWSGLLYSPPGDLPNPGIVPISLMSVWIGRRVLYHKHHLGSPIELYHPLKALSKRDQSWVFIGRTDAKAETSILW